MDRKKLLIAGGLTGIIIILLGVWLFISLNSVSADSSTTVQENAVFNAKTSQEKAIFIARLNKEYGFEQVEGTDNVLTVYNVSLTSDGKYWIVNLHERLDYGEGNVSYNWVVTVDAKTLMSKMEGGYGEPTAWRSVDELVAIYIAGMQTIGANGGSEVHKITMDGKEIWKITNHYYNDGNPEQIQYIYVDVATGKSKNYRNGFNQAAGTEGWKTLKEVEESINMDHLQKPQFSDALRDLYSE